MKKNESLLQGGSYVEWSAIIAGAVLACAFSTTLLQFGSVVGISDSVTSDMFNENTAGDPDWSIARFMAGGVWVLFIQVFASIGGGYLAGRMRSPFAGVTPHESEVRDGIHGLLAWATATLAVVVGASAVAAFGTIVADQTGNLQGAELTDTQQNAGVIMAFAVGAASILSAGASWAAAVKGGEHRDTGVDFSRHVSFK